MQNYLKKGKKKHFKHHSRPFIFDKKAKNQIFCIIYLKNKNINKHFVTLPSC
jgi:hypothetical protein